MNDIDIKIIKDYLKSFSRKDLDTLQYALLWVEEGGGLGEEKLKQLFEAVNEVDAETRG